MSNNTLGQYNKLYSPDFIGSSNFITNGLSKVIPDTNPCNYYYLSDYRIIASNTCNVAGWGSAKSSNSDFTIGSPPLPSNFTITRINNNSLGVFITVNKNQTNLPDCNWFYYSVSNTSNFKRNGGDACNVLREENAPYNTYSGPIDFGSNATIYYDPQIYDQDITFSVFGSNYLGDTKTSIKLCNAYTGLQCNVDNPVLSNFIATINCNTGEIIFYGTVREVNLGALTWYITQETDNNARNSFLGPYYGHSNNFTISSNVPEGSNLRYYYSNSQSRHANNNIITGRYYLEVYNSSDAGWLNKSNINSNSITPIAPFPNIKFNVLNAGSLNVSIKPELCNSTNGPTVNKFYYYLSEGREVKPTSYSGPFEMGTKVAISNTDDFYNQYNCNIRFHVAVSNVLYTSLDLTEQTCNVYTGPQCNLDVPTIDNFTVLMNNDGTARVGGTVSNILGNLGWYLEFSNNYNNTIFNSINFNVPSNITYCNRDMVDTYNTNFLQFYSNTVTLYASNTSNYWISKSNSSTFITSPYNLVAPNLVTPTFTGDASPYTLITSNTIYNSCNYGSVGGNGVVTTIWTLSNANIDITADITSSNNLSILFNNAQADINYTVGAYFMITDSGNTNIFYGPTCNVSATKLVNTGVMQGVTTGNIALVFTGNPSKMILNINSTVFPDNYGILIGGNSAATSIINYRIGYLAAGYIFNIETVTDNSYTYLDTISVPNISIDESGNNMSISISHTQITLTLNNNVDTSGTIYYYINYNI